MVRNRFNNLLFTLAVILFSTSCQDNVSETIRTNAPVFMTYAELRAPGIIHNEEEKDLDNTGKIYLKGDYIFINDKYKGVHIIDNSNPENPSNVGYISIIGNTDVSIKGNYLFANSFCDLVVLDISDLENVKEISRLEEVFQYAYPEVDNGFGTYFKNDPDEQGIIVGWELKEIPASQYTNYGGFRNGGLGLNTAIDVVQFDAAFAESASVGGGSASTGTGGSMASFKLYGNFLYAIEGQTTIQVVDITNPFIPKEGEEVRAGWGLETLFIKDDKLFIGSMEGMYIYDLVEPAIPSYISMISHMRSCDPVVVEGKYAYVTLRGGSMCGGAENQLDVIDIEDLENPQLVKTYSMTNPHGLGIDNGTLFICDGKDGLKIFDASDPLSITDNKLSHFKKLDAFDVIPVKGNLMLIGKDGLFQYNYMDRDNIEELSHLKIK